MNQPAYGIVNLLLYKGLINQCNNKRQKGIAITGVVLRKQEASQHITEIIGFVSTGASS